MSKVIQFGEDVEGYTIPVLNEREVRAAAGIMFLVLLISVMQAGGKGDFLMIKYFVTVFLADMLIRVFVNPKYAPTLIIGRLIVKRQVPEYVGAKQKKFAWYIGLFLASTMFVLMVLMNTYSAISGLSCFICLIFLFFESAFGICLGCIVYKWIYKEKAQYCPGEVCEIKDRQEIQKTSLVQWMIVLGLVVFVVLLAYAFNDHMSLKPVELFTGEGLPQ